MIAMTEALVVVDIQLALAADDGTPPPSELLSRWANEAYRQVATSATEITIRLVGESEMAELNATYRGKQGTTNVLSFPFDNEFDLTAIPETDNDVMADMLSHFLGDIVICHSVIEREAREQNKLEAHHYAHMVVHGVLHLCGYDHINNDDAEEMEALEVKILAKSNIENPYT